MVSHENNAPTRLLFDAQERNDNFHSTYQVDLSVHCSTCLFFEPEVRLMILDEIYRMNDGRCSPNPMLTVRNVERMSRDSETNVRFEDDGGGSVETVNDVN